MGQRLRNTVIKPLAASGEGDVLNIPSFSEQVTQVAPKVEISTKPFINPNPTAQAAWEQSLVETGITPKLPPENIPQQINKMLQDLNAGTTPPLPEPPIVKPKQPVPGMEFEPGVISKTPPSLQLDIAKIQTGGKGGVVDSIKQSFANWVNARRASRLEGYIKQKDFQELDSEGLEGIFKFQAGENQGLYSTVKEFFNTKYQELQDAGLTLGYKENYLPQLWNNTPEEIAQVFGRRLGLKPSFAFPRIIKDYQTGIDAGLTPRFNTISELAGWYEGRANRALADLEFFKSLSKEGIILPKGRAPFGWITLDADRFPKFQVSKGEKVYSGTFSAPQEVADLINNYLKDPQDPVIAAIAAFASRAKNITLTFGIPGTAINMHGINILARHTLFGTGGNPISRLLTGVKYLVNQKAAQNYLDKVLEEAPKAMKQGLTIGVEDFKGFVDVIEPGLKAQFGDKWHTLFEKPLFDRMIPALKVSSWQNLANDLGKKMARNIAEKEAAKIVNNVYGGINWEAMGRNRDLQNWLRAFVLAPDWAETTLRLGGNLVKSFTQGGPVAARYRTMTTTFIASYVAANIANKLSSGHMLYENDPGHTFEIEIGYTADGQKRYYRPYGTAADFARLPYDTILSLAKGDPTPIAKTFTNRLSIPVSSIGHLGFNVDYRGTPLYGKDRYGNEIPFPISALNVGAEAAKSVGVPSFIQQGIKTASGQQGLEQGILQGFELPFRYSGGAYSKSQKTATGVAKAGGLEGEDLYNVNQAMRGVSLSKNQAELLRQGGIGILPDILQLKEQNKMLNEAKKVQEKIEGGDITEEKGTQEIEELIKKLETNQRLETSKQQTDTGLVQTAQAAETGSFGLTPVATSFPKESIVGGPIYKQSIVSPETAQATEPKSLLQQQLAENLAWMKVQTTGQSQEANGQIFYANENGNKASVPLDRPIYQPALTGDPVVDKMELQDMAASYTAKMGDVQTLYRLGKLTQEEYVAKINELYIQQKEARAKYGKPKKIKFPKLRARLSKPKKITVKKLKFTPLKLSLGKITGARAVKIKVPPTLRTSPLTLKKLNLKFKQTLPQTIRGLGR